MIKKYIEKIFGRTEFVVTATCVDGSVVKRIFETISQVDLFVSDTNNDIYWMVSKIEKFKRFPFEYNKKQITHKALDFQIEGVTELDVIDGFQYSFLIADDSLTNVRRIN